MATNFKFGDLDIHIDSSDIVMLRKFRDAQEKYVKIMEEAPTTDYIAVLEHSIKAMTDMLDEVLGNGTSNKMFGPTITSFDRVLEGFAALRDYFQQAQAERIERVSSYSPRNRAERRARK